MPLFSSSTSEASDSHRSIKYGFSRIVLTEVKTGNTEDISTVLTALSSGFSSIGGSFASQPKSAAANITADPSQIEDMCAVIREAKIKGRPVCISKESSRLSGSTTYGGVKGLPVYLSFSLLSPASEKKSFLKKKDFRLRYGDLIAICYTNILGYEKYAQVSSYREWITFDEPWPRVSKDLKGPSTFKITPPITSNKRKGEVVTDHDEVCLVPTTKSKHYIGLVDDYLKLVSFPGDLKVPPKWTLNLILGPEEKKREKSLVKKLAPAKKTMYCAPVISPHETIASKSMLEAMLGDLTGSDESISNLQASGTPGGLTGTMLKLAF